MRARHSASLWRTPLLGLLLALGTMLAALPAAAQSDSDLESAREQFRLGNEAYNAGNYDEAIQHFEEANRTVPNARLELYIGQCYTLLGHSSEARQHIQAYADSSREAADEVRDLLEQLEQAQSEIMTAAQRAVDAAWRLAAGIPPEAAPIDPNAPVVPVQIRSNPAGAEVFIDDEALGSIGRTPLDTELFVGPHHVIVRLANYATYRERVNVVRGSVPVVNATLERQNVQVDISFNPMTARGTFVSPTGETTDLGMGSYHGELPAGPGVFILQRSGTSRRIEMDIQGEGGVQSFTLNLNAADDTRGQLPQLGTLIIRSDQARVTITIDGVEVGTGVGDFETQQTPGPHSIRATRDGYRAVTDTIDVYAGERTSWRLPPMTRQ